MSLFDAHNRPRTVATTSATGPVRASSWTWRRDGLLGRVDTAFGPSPPTSSVYGTDRFGRQSHESHGLVGLPAMASGAVRSRALSRYAERGTAWATLTLDAADNWRTLTTQNEEIKDITAGSDNRLLHFGVPIASDAAGRVLGDEHGARYVYDGLGHLSTATADGHALHFAYDGLGRLATLRSGDGEEVQQHLGGVLLRQVVDGSGRTYVPGPTSTPVALVGPGRRLGLHHGLGQRIEAVTGEDGGLIERVAYSAFGAPSFFKADGSEVGGSTVGLGVLVSGQAYVAEPGLHWLGARWGRSSMVTSGRIVGQITVLRGALLRQVHDALGLDALLRGGPGADGALGEVVVARRAVLAAEEDDLEVEAVPALAGEEGLEVLLGLLDVAGAGQAPA